MSLYTDAQALLTRLESYVTVDIPAVRWAQLGSPILTCESMAVGVTTAREESLFTATAGGRDCQVYSVLDITAIIARDCAFEGDQDGNTDPEQVAAVSVRQDADATALIEWVKSLPQPTGSLNSHSFVSEGGLALTVTTTSVYGGWVVEEAP